MHARDGGDHLQQLDYLLDSVGVVCNRIVSDRSCSRVGDSTEHEVTDGIPRCAPQLFSEHTHGGRINGIMVERSIRHHTPPAVSNVLTAGLFGGITAYPYFFA